MIGGAPPRSVILNSFACFVDAPDICHFNSFLPTCAFLASLQLCSFDAMWGWAGFLLKTFCLVGCPPSIAELLMLSTEYMFFQAVPSRYQLMMDRMNQCLRPLMLRAPQLLKVGALCLIPLNFIATSAIFKLLLEIHWHNFSLISKVLPHLCFPF